MPPEYSQPSPGRHSDGDVEAANHARCTADSAGCAEDTISLALDTRDLICDQPGMSPSKVEPRRAGTRKQRAAATRHRFAHLVHEDRYRIGLAGVGGAPRA